MKALQLARLMPASKAHVRSFGAAMTWDAENNSAVPAFAGFRGTPMQTAPTELRFPMSVDSDTFLEVPRAGPAELGAVWLLGMMGSLASWYGLIRAGVWVISKLAS